MSLHECRGNRRAVPQAAVAAKYQNIKRRHGGKRGIKWRRHQAKKEM